jgi:hypothetical protein
VLRWWIGVIVGERYHGEFPLGTLPAELIREDKTVIDGILGIDVSKNALDVSISSCSKVRTKSFAPSFGLAGRPKDRTSSRMSGIDRAL